VIVEGLNECRRNKVGTKKSVKRAGAYRRCATTGAAKITRVMKAKSGGQVGTERGEWGEDSKRANGREGG